MQARRLEGFVRRLVQERGQSRPVGQCPGNSSRCGTDVKPEISSLRRVRFWCIDRPEQGQQTILRSAYRVRHCRAAIPGQRVQHGSAAPRDQ